MKGVYNMAFSIVKKITANFRKIRDDDAESIIASYTPEPIMESAEYKKYRDKTLDKRINQLIKNYTEDPEHFELSSIEFVFREIDSVTSDELGHIHREYARQCKQLRENIMTIYSDIARQDEVIASIMQALENEYADLQTYLTEYRRPIVIEHSDDNEIPLMVE